MRISVTELPAVTKYEVALGISTGLRGWRRVGFLGRNGVLAPYPLGREVYGPVALRPFDGFDCSLACGTTSTSFSQYASRPDVGEKQAPLPPLREQS